MDLPHNHDAMYHRGDVGQYRQLENVVAAVEPELVYHLGAEFGRFNGEDFYETMWRSNAVGTKHMLRLQEARKFRMVFFSSSEVYGDYDGVMTEEVPHTVPIRQLNDYAISKWVNELQVMNSADRFGTETVRVRLFNTYGPGEHYSTYRSVVCQFAYRALAGIPYTVYSEHTRTLTYIDDSIDALANIATNFKPGEVYNIAGDESVNMRELSDMILDATGGSPDLVTDTPIEAHNTLHKKTSNEKAKRELGMATRTDLKQGIANTVEWLRDTYGF